MAKDKSKNGNGNGNGNGSSKKKAKKVDYQKMLDEQTDKIVKQRMEAEFKSKGLI